MTGVALTQQHPPSTIPKPQGECGTCESELNGKKIRMCKAIVPRGMRKNECTIKVLK